MTKVRKIISTEWKLVTSNACAFQVLGENEAYVTESSSKPDITNDDYKIALSKEIYTFDPNDGKLYARSKGTDNSIGYDLI